MDLTDKKYIKDLLSEEGIRLSKALGQHFLISKDALIAVVREGEIDKKDTVVEIGAGIGVLTWELCQRAGKVISFEMDERLARVNKRIVGKNCANLELRVGDALDLPWQFENGYKVVSNLPYQITTPVIRRFLGSEVLPERMVLLVQKEVAERLAASPGDRNRGWVSVLVQLYGRPWVAATVSPESFLPPPEVESAILVIDDICKPKGVDADRVITVVKAGFSSKRRQLPNALAGGLGIGLDKAREAVEKAGVDMRRRAETLTNVEWYRLSEVLSKDGLV